MKKQQQGFQGTGMKYRAGETSEEAAVTKLS